MDYGYEDFEEDMLYGKSLNEIKEEKGVDVLVECLNVWMDEWGGDVEKDDYLFYDDEDIEVLKEIGFYELIG